MDLDSDAASEPSKRQNASCKSKRNKKKEKLEVFIEFTDSDYEPKDDQNPRRGTRTLTLDAFRRLTAAKIEAWNAKILVH